MSAFREVRPRFTGSAGEYFRIWIVNLFFSVMTLGVFSAWAKVRKKRYFYGSTRFDGDTFDYFANPKAILAGRVLAVVVFALYALAGDLYALAGPVFWAVAFLVFPWVIVRALAFNARNSAYRGLRFDFVATTRQAAGVYIGRMLAVLLTLGIAFPWFMAKQKAFVVSHYAFGTTRFHCELPVKSFFGIYLRGGLIIVAFSVPAGLATFALSRWVRGFDADWLGTAAWILPLLVVYAGYVVSYGYIQAQTANLLWNNTTGAGMRFRSSLSASRLIRLYLGNIVAAALSAGLLIPWTVVRTLRYRLDNFAGLVDDDVVHEASASLPPVGAASQELGDIFNVDLGL